MKAEYPPDELLPLSGIQHFLFCRRQWALIYVERQWQENVLTVEGKLLHKRADDPFFSETRKGVITARSVPIASYRLGLSGVCDVVEFTESPEGMQLPGREGLFLPAPVEYKRGKEKHDHSDESQLCAQAICLEEMLSVAIPSGQLHAFGRFGELDHIAHARQPQAIGGNRHRAGSNHPFSRFGEKGVIRPLVQQLAFDSERVFLPLALDMDQRPLPAAKNEVLNAR